MTTKLLRIKSALRESIELASKAAEGPWLSCLQHRLQHSRIHRLRMARRMMEYISHHPKILEYAIPDTEAEMWSRIEKRIWRNYHAKPHEQGTPWQRPAGKLQQGDFLLKA